MKISPATESILQQEIKLRKLPEEFMTTVTEWYFPIAREISKAHSDKEGVLVVSFNGAQGSGKSTITAFLRLILNHQFELHTVELSIDDFYLTKKERLQLARDIHPLFSTRGVPGTHDINLASNTIDCLKHCSKNQPCALPRFDKASDDREAENIWPRVKKPVDIILFEGWCNHAPVQQQNELEQPINELETDEDDEVLWRGYANEQLKEYHRRLFDQADLLIYLQVPSFEKVYEWRGLQEQKLAQSGTEIKHAVMDEKQLQRFIQHYERITRLCLKELPGQADIVLKLNDEHGIESLKFRSDTN